SADSMQRIEPRTTTGVLPLHLFDNDFGIGKNVECSSAKFQGTLECLKKCDVLGDIIVLVADPLLDFDRPTCRTVDHHSNAGRAGIHEGSAIDIGNRIRHVLLSCSATTNRGIGCA